MTYIYFVRVVDKNTQEVLEYLDFTTRFQLGLFFESAKFSDNVYYKVTRACP